MISNTDFFQLSFEEQKTKMLAMIDAAQVTTAEWLEIREAIIHNPWVDEGWITSLYHDLMQYSQALQNRQHQAAQQALQNAQRSLQLLKEREAALSIQTEKESEDILSAINDL